MKTDEFFQETDAAVGLRAIHLDLKGLPPTPERLMQFLRIVAAFRYNAVVVEWEDMFPWTTNKRLRCETAYSPETVKEFVTTAADLGIELIPLVQCLGHLEFVLKHGEYASMREVADKVDVINPLTIIWMCLLANMQIPLPVAPVMLRFLQGKLVTARSVKP